MSTRSPSELPLRLEFTGNTHFRLEASGAAVPRQRTQAIAKTLPAVVRNEPGKTLGLFLAGNQRLDQRNINANAVGDATGTDLVGVELGDDAHLLVAVVMALPRVTERG